MEAIFSLLSAGLGGALINFLLRGWISERLKQSIQHEYAQKFESIRHEYAQKLETHKAELNTSMQAVLYERQLYQLRTSLFFDHQREAFASLLSQIAEIKRKWIEISDPEEGIIEPVPHEEYEKFKKSFYDNQLFLDSDCILSIDLVLEIMRDSFPFIDGSGNRRYRDCSKAYDNLEFLHDRVAELFQKKIGIGALHTAKREIALLGAIRLLNYYHFDKIDLPVKGALELTDQDNAADAVIKANENEAALILKLKEIREYLKKDGLFHEGAKKAVQYLEILDNKDEIPRR